MITIDSTQADKAAIAFSVLCALHCLLTPLLAVTLPSLSAIFSDSELYHRLMIAFVVPISIYALALGCKNHRRYPILALGTLGLGILVFAAFWGGPMFGHVGEILLTLVGSTTIAAGHLINYRLCRTCQRCDQ